MGADGTSGTSGEVTPEPLGPVDAGPLGPVEPPPERRRRPKARHRSGRCRRPEPSREEPPDPPEEVPRPEPLAREPWAGSFRHRGVRPAQGRRRRLGRRGRGRGAEGRGSRAVAGPSEWDTVEGHEGCHRQKDDQGARGQRAWSRQGRPGSRAGEPVGERGAESTRCGRACSFVSIGIPTRLPSTRNRRRITANRGRIGDGSGSLPKDRNQLQERARRGGGRGSADLERSFGQPPSRPPPEPLAPPRTWFGGAAHGPTDLVTQVGMAGSPADLVEGAGGGAVDGAGGAAGRPGQVGARGVVDALARRWSRGRSSTRATGLHPVAAAAGIGRAAAGQVAAAARDAADRVIVSAAGVAPTARATRAGARATGAGAGGRMPGDRGARGPEGGRRGCGRGAGVRAEVGGAGVVAGPSQRKPLEGDEGGQREEDHQRAGGQRGGRAETGDIGTQMSAQMAERGVDEVCV